MFENLTQRLSGAFGALRGKRTLDEENVEEGLRTVRTALLEADVHFQVARDFVEDVRGKVLGAELVRGVDPSEQFVHAVHGALVELMGPEGARLTFARTPPTVPSECTSSSHVLDIALQELDRQRPLDMQGDSHKPISVRVPPSTTAASGIPPSGRDPSKEIPESRTPTSDGPEASSLAPSALASGTTPISARGSTGTPEHEQPESADVVAISTMVETTRCRCILS